MNTTVGLLLGLLLVANSIIAVDTASADFQLIQFVGFMGGLAFCLYCIIESIFGKD